MTSANHDELVNRLNELLQGQTKQIELTELALEMARTDAIRRDALIAQYGESVAQAKQQNEKTLRRYRMQVRVYGLMMVVFGAVFALLLLSAIRSG
jgi:hypothetical protein